MTKSRVARALAVAGVTMALAVTATTADAQKRVRWKMQSTFGSSVPHLGTSALRYEKNIGRLSDGKFQIKFHEPGALVPALECFDAASKGSVESCWTTPGYHTGKLGPGISFFTTVPFGHQESTLNSIKEHVQGKIVVDTTVSLVPPKVARVQLPPEGSAVGTQLLPVVANQRPATPAAPSSAITPYKPHSQRRG